jgi:hypothetical protein
LDLENIPFSFSPIVITSQPQTFPESRKKLEEKNEKTHEENYLALIFFKKLPFF